MEENIRFLIVWVIATFIACVLVQLDLAWWQNMLGGTISMALCLAAFHLTKRWS